MSFVLARNWWSLVIRGIIGILAGIIAFTWPGVTFRALLLLFAAYVLIDGVVDIIGAVRAADAGERWGALLFEGIVGILAAVVTIFWPAITAFALVFVIAAWAIITGIAEIAAAVRLRQHVSGEWLLGLAGVISVLFGVFMLARPLAGALVLALWFGAYAFIFGVVMIALGFRLRDWEHHHHIPGSAAPMPAR
jgi:uncharacterized membrane protein HdeD (DUF308 family)